jgi:transposase, IS5 family
MKQHSLASQSVFEKYGRKSRRELFLEEMEKEVPWSGLEALMRPHYAKTGKGRSSEIRGTRKRALCRQKGRYSL